MAADHGFAKTLSHPDCTVGFGIAPNLSLNQQEGWLRTCGLGFSTSFKVENALPPVGNCTLPRRSLENSMPQRSLLLQELFFDYKLANWHRLPTGVIITIQAYAGRTMSAEIRIIPIKGIGEISPGADLGKCIYQALLNQDLTLEQGDILVVTQKIVSKAEERIVHLTDVQPSLFAQSIAKQGQKDARHMEIVLRESKRIVRMDRGIIIS